MERKKIEEKKLERKVGDEFFFRLLRKELQGMQTESSE